MINSYCTYIAADWDCDSKEERISTFYRYGATETERGY